MKPTTKPATPLPPRTWKDLVLATDLCEDTVKKLILKGELPGYKAGKSFVIPGLAFAMWERGEWSPKKPDNVVDLDERRAS